MTDIAYISLTPYLGVESTKGTRARAEKYLHAFSFEPPSPEDAITTHVPVGSKYPTSIARGAVHVTGSLSGKMDYRASMFMWTMLFGDPTTTDNGDGSYTHVWRAYQRRRDGNKTLSLQWGDEVQESSAKYCFLTEGGFSLDAQGGDFMEISGSYIAQQKLYDKIRYIDVKSGESGDTFSLSVTTVDTTIPIAVDADDATIQSAITSLLNVSTATVTTSTGTSVEFTSPAGITTLEVVDDTTSGGSGVSVSGSSPTFSLDIGSGTSGTYRLRVTNTETATGVTFSATAATIQSDLEGLVCLSSGDVVCSGGPLNTAPVMVEVGGNWLNTQYGYREIGFSVDGAGMVSSDSSVEITRISPDVTEVAMIPMTVNDSQFYLAHKEEELTTATFLPRVFNAEFALSDKRAAVFQLQRQRGSFTSDIETSEVSVEFTLGVGSAVGSSLRFWKQTCGNNVFWGRLESESCQQITGSANNFKQVIDMALLITTEGGDEDMESSAGNSWTLGIGKDPSKSHVMKISLTNDIASLSAI